MAKMRSLVTIHHSPVASNKEQRDRRVAGDFNDVKRVTINPREVFDPAAVGLSHDEVQRMVDAGHIVDADDLDLVPGPAALAGVRTAPPVADQQQPQGAGPQAAEQQPTNATGQAK